MKARVLCLSLTVALAFLPLIAMATELPSYSTDIKAYGDQSASHSVGTLKVDTYEITNTDFHNSYFEGTKDVMNGCPDGGNCKFTVEQGDYSTGYDSGHTYATSDIDVTNYMGSVDMSSFGGMAVCTTNPPAATGSFYQTQNVNQTVTNGGNGISNYNGTQTLNLKSLYAP